MKCSTILTGRSVNSCPAYSNHVDNLRHHSTGGTNARTRTPFTASSSIAVCPTSTTEGTSTTTIQSGSICDFSSTTNNENEELINTASERQQKVVKLQDEPEFLDGITIPVITEELETTSMF